jgi:hypothetical protein
MRPARSRTTLAAAFAAIVLLSFTACTEKVTTPERAAVGLPLLLGGGTGTHYQLSHVPPAFRRVAGFGRASASLLAVDDPMEFDGQSRLDATTNSFISFADNGTAYFRDKLVEEDAILRASFDGQTWDTKILFPDGHFDLGGVITFRATSNGETDCFILGPFSQLCGSTEAFLFTYINVQCAPKGLYTFVGLTPSGTDHYQVHFTLVEQVPPSAFPSLLQSSFSDAYDNACKGAKGTVTCPDTTGQIPKTIAQKGCALTSVAMAMNAAGVPTTVLELNTWMNTNGGFADEGNLLFDRFQAYAKSKGANVGYERLDGVTPAALRSLICQFGPQVLEVKVKHAGSPDSTQHFVLATGIGADGNPTIADPGDGSDPSLANYGNKYVSVRKMQRKEAITDTLADGLVISFYSPGEIMLTDPAGHRVGYDPTKGSLLSEIASGHYEQHAQYSSVSGDGIFDDDEHAQPKMIEVSNPTVGDYAVNVTGTGTGTYLLRIDGFGPGGNTTGARFANVPITPGEQHAYTFHYDPSQMGQPGVSFPLSGAFNGGGQSAASDKMLTYARPGQKTTTLPAGTTSYSMQLFYNAGLTAGTFSAVLNGIDITSSFHPTAGGNEIVSLALVSGRNVLKLAAKGVANGRNASDSDQLVFKVQ